MRLLGSLLKRRFRDFVFWDSFNGAAVVSLPSHVPEKPRVAAWQEIAGSTWRAHWEGQRATYGGPGGQVVAAYDVGVADVAIWTRMAQLSGDFGLVLRLTDNDNYILLAAGSVQANNLRLFRRQAGAFTDIGAAAYTAAVGDVLCVRARGSTITAWVNGVRRLTVTETFNETATRIGLRENADFATWEFLYAQRCLVT